MKVQQLAIWDQTTVSFMYKQRYEERERVYENGVGYGVIADVLDYIGRCWETCVLRELNPHSSFSWLCRFKLGTPGTSDSCCSRIAPLTGLSRVGFKTNRKASHVSLHGHKLAHLSWIGSTTLWLLFTATSVLCISKRQVQWNNEKWFIIHVY